MNVRACSECGAENPALAKFCMSCGASLALACPDCGVPRQPGAAFCVECGARFGAATETRPETGSAAGPEARELSEERRNATVLFADLSGYTALAERLDPEVTKSLVDHALGRLSREVVEHGGRVDKYIGDNVMAVFGAPVAHEDDPERAVRAGLAMQAAMSEINVEIGARAASGDVEMELRVGVNSGAVIAGRSGDQYTVIGDTVNVAARLQAAGRPGEVTVGPATRRLTATAIEYRELEPLTLKGKAQPMPAWEAVEVVDEASRPKSGRPVAPLIGRDEELALLLSLFDRALRESRPHLVTVFGQAGVGKSRLLSELATALRRRGERVDTLIGRSPAYGTATTYSALGEIIRERFAISAGDAPDAIVDKLTDGIAGLTHGDQEADAARTAAQVARVLGIDSRGDGDEEVDEQVRDRIFAAVRFLLQLIAENAPVVIAIEDIHWADEGMLDLIEHVAGSGQGPILIVCLARDELLDRRPSWGSGRRNATTISLDALSTDETEELVEVLLAGRAGDPDLAEQVAGRSGGNPLFAEEMVNRLREEQSEDAGELPDSVHAVLAARLDALDPDERHLLQAASVIGQSFWEGTVSELVGEAAIDASLATLVDKDLLSPSTAGRLAGEQEFSFKHALVRDVAYATLPRGLRARQHVEIARIVEGRAGENREGVAAILAEHHGRAADLAEQAGLPEEEQRSMRVQAAYALSWRVTWRLRSTPTPRRSSITTAPCASPVGSSRPTGPGSRSAEAIRLSERATSMRPSSPGPKRSSSGATKRTPPGPGAPPQDRHGPLAQGRPGVFDRTVPARHRPAQGRRSMPGADRAVRGGGLALRRDRRQHARDLRCREGTTAGGDPRSVVDRQPSPPHVRSRFRTDRRPRSGPGQPRALGQLARKLGRARRFRRCSRSAATSTSRRSTIRRPRRSL